MKNKTRKAVAGFLAGLMAVSTVIGLATPALASDSVIEKDGFTFEKITSQGGINYYKITNYNGDSPNVVIPDTVGEATNVVLDIGTDVFYDHLEIKKLTIGKYMIRGNEFVFDDLKGVTEYDVAEGNSKYSVDDGVLYRENMLLAYPKSKTGSYTIKDGTTNIGKRAFFETEIDTLTIPKSVKIDNQLNDEGTKYIYSFLGANVDRYHYGDSTDGAIIKDGRLIAYGNNADADISGITEANPYAFSSESVLNRVRNQLPESILTTVPFSFYSGEIDDLNTSYFNIDGKSAYCYDYGKLNPETVGPMVDYDNLISSEETRHAVKAILFAGYPNDAYGLLGSTGVDIEAAKNITGALIWNEVSHTDFDINRIYGTDDIQAAEDYANMLQEKASVITDSEMQDMELGFYHGSENTQGLVVIHKIYRPDPKPSVSITKKDHETNAPLEGATLKLVKLNPETEIERWTSTTVAHVINDLEDGEYRLIEVNAPSGYMLADPIDFTVTDGVILNPTITMYDVKISEEQKTVFSKVDATSLEELPGASLILKKDGIEVEAWTSTKTPHEILNLEDGSYELIEVAAPEGYEIAESIQFTVTNGKASVNPIIMKDEKTPIPGKFIISKKDLTNKEELPGAKLELKRGSETVEVWTSSNAAREFENLPDGEYSLTEVTAPEGYELAETITFNVINGTVENGQVVMYDARIPEDNYIIISKIDAVTGKELPGATLILKKGDVVIDEWVSTNTPHEIKVTEDGIYTLIEKTAPSGYEVAESITFTVENGKVVGGKIIMKDKPIEKNPDIDPEPKPDPKPEPQPEPKPEPDPKPEPTPTPKPEKKPEINGSYSGSEVPKKDTNSKGPEPETIITPEKEEPKPEPAPEERVPEDIPQPERKPVKTGDNTTIITRTFMILSLIGIGGILLFKKKKKI